MDKVLSLAQKIEILPTVMTGYVSTNLHCDFVSFLLVGSIGLRPLGELLCHLYDTRVQHLMRELALIKTVFKFFVILVTEQLGSQM